MQPLIAAFAAVVLAGAGAYMVHGSAGPSATLGWLFIGVGILGVIGNLAVYVLRRRS